MIGRAEEISERTEEIMQLKAIVASAFLVSVLPHAAAGQDTERYTLERSGNGYVRMDRKTGEMSICEERSGQLVCRLAADERSALQDEVDRLQDRLSGLEKRIVELETTSRPNAQRALFGRFRKVVGMSASSGVSWISSRPGQELASRRTGERTAKDVVL
jgi:hypothetical protein